MSCIQTIACLPADNITSICSSWHALSMPWDARQSFKASLIVSSFALPYRNTTYPKASLKLTAAASRYDRCAPVCLFGWKGKSENDNKASLWNAAGSLKKESVEHVLRQQIQKQEYYDDGGSGRNRPGGGGGSGGSKDEGRSWNLDELLQVILATIGFIFLYISITEGHELTLLAKDYIKFLFGAQKSFRLKRSMDNWGKFFQRLTQGSRRLNHIGWNLKLSILQCGGTAQKNISRSSGLY